MAEAEVVDWLLPAISATIDLSAVEQVFWTGCEQTASAFLDFLRPFLVDNMLGLAVFYQHVRTAALNHQYRDGHVTVLTTELFAYYLQIKYLSLSLRLHFAQTSADVFKLYLIRINESVQLFTGDVLLYVSVSRLLKEKSYHKPDVQHSHQLTMNLTEYNASDLVELLQKAAVEHLTTFRRMEARDFGSVVTIVTTDFTALYAYKCGDHLQCLQLSTQNVHTLMHAVRMPEVPLSSMFIQLLDNDIVSLIALTRIINVDCKKYRSSHDCISQMTLSLYLMTQCQLKLRHTVTSLAQTLDYIKVAHRSHPVKRILDRLILKMIAHKAMTHIIA